jgi:hypothetical protein
VNAERLASTPRQCRPIDDPVLQGSWLGILNGLPLGASGAGLTSPHHVESKDDIA